MKTLDSLTRSEEARSRSALRDEMAAAALAGGLNQAATEEISERWWVKPSKIAERAYAIADAMLEERDKSRR